MEFLQTTADILLKISATAVFGYMVIHFYQVLDDVKDELTRTGYHVRILETRLEDVEEQLKEERK